MSTPPKHTKAFSFAYEKIACGKAACRTCRGTHLAHGPYWYAYFTKPKGGTGKVYVGKDLDGWCQLHGVTSHANAPKEAKKHAKKRTPKTAESEDWERMLKAGTPILAAKLLGVKPGISRGILTCAYREAIKTAHPDKGGNATHAAALNAAFALLRKLVK